MPIFNETFTDDKPIYYPSTWDTGKTAPQLYEQWRLTPQFFILSNLIQCVIAGAWMCFVYVIVSALHEMWKQQFCLDRLHKLDDDNRVKISSRQYISKKFLMSTSFIGFIVFSVTFILVVYDQFTRNALIKGFLFCIFVIGLRKAYQKGKVVYINWKKTRNQYENIQKENSDEED